MIVYTPPQPATNLEVIDLAPSFSTDPADCADVAWKIHQACRDTGFFYVANHGVAASLIADQFAWSRRFFELPLAEKLPLHMKNSASTAGYEPIGGQQLDSQDAASAAAPPDLKESFYCYMDLPDDHAYALRRLRNYGHNQWPAVLPGFREQMLAYQEALSRLGDRVLSLLALSLDLPKDWFAPFYEMPGLTLRLLRYPPHPETARPNQLGAGAHTDWGGITLLAQDESGGLEVRNAAGQWIEASPVAGTFVVNLGDLMARWTNGLYNSNLHRVKNNRTGKDRYSVPFFYAPRYDAVIDAIPTCVTADRPRRFATCTASEHKLEMFRRSYGFVPQR